MAILNYRQFDMLLSAYSTIFDSAKFSSTGQGVRIYPFTITSGMYFITEKGNYSISEMEGAIFHKQNFASINTAIDGFAPICANWDAVQHMAINMNALLNTNQWQDGFLPPHSMFSYETKVPTTIANATIHWINIDGANQSVLSNSVLSPNDTKVIYHPWHDAFIKLYNARRVNKGTKIINNIVTEIEGIDADLTIISPDWNPNMFEQLGKVYVVLDEKISTPLVFKIVNATPMFNPDTNELQYCTIQFKNVDLSFSEQNEGIFNYVHFSKPGDETIFPYETLVEVENGAMIATLPQYGTSGQMKDWTFADAKSVDSVQVYNNAMVGIMGLEMYGHYTYFVGNFQPKVNPIPGVNNWGFGYITSTPFPIFANKVLPFINNSTDKLINKVTTQYVMLPNMITLNEELWPSWRIAQETTYNPISDRNFQGGLGGYGAQNQYILNDQFQNWVNSVFPSGTGQIVIGASGIDAMQQLVSYYGSHKIGQWQKNIINIPIKNTFSLWMIDVTGHYGNYYFPTASLANKNGMSLENCIIAQGIEPLGGGDPTEYNWFSTQNSIPALINYGYKGAIVSNIFVQDDTTIDTFCQYLNINTFTLFNIDELAVSYKYGVIFKDTAPFTSTTSAGVMNDITSWFSDLANDIKGYTPGWDEYFYNTQMPSKSYTLFVPQDAVSLGMNFLNPEKTPSTSFPYAIPFDIFSNQYSRLTATGQLKFACGFRVSLSDSYYVQQANAVGANNGYLTPKQIASLPTYSQSGTTYLWNEISSNLTLNSRYLGQNQAYIDSELPSAMLATLPIVTSSWNATITPNVTAGFIEPNSNPPAAPWYNLPDIPQNCLAFFAASAPYNYPIVIDSVKYKQVGQNNIRLSFYDNNNNQVGQSWVKSSAYIKQNFQYITNNFKYNFYTGYNFNTNGMTGAFPTIEIPEPPSTT